MDIKGVLDKGICFSIYNQCKNCNQTPTEAFDFFQLVGGNPDASYKQGKAIFDSFDNAPLVSVSVDIVLDFYKNPKSDFEIATFSAFCGIRSIIGAKLFVKTNNALLIARMFGHRSIKEFEALNEKPKYCQDFFRNKRTIAYHLNKKILEQELCLSWGLRYYANQSRGFYVSFKMDLAELVLHAEKSRKTYILEQQQIERKEAIKWAKEQLKRR